MKQIVETNGTVEMLMPALREFDPKLKPNEEKPIWANWCWHEMGELHQAITDAYQQYLGQPTDPNVVVTDYRTFFPTHQDETCQWVFSWIVYNSRTGGITFTQGEIETCPFPKLRGRDELPMYHKLFVPAKWGIGVIKLAGLGIASISRKNGLYKAGLVGGKTEVIHWKDVQALARIEA